MKWIVCRRLSDVPRHLIEGSSVCLGGAKAWPPGAPCAHKETASYSSSSSSARAANTMTQMPSRAPTPTSVARVLRMLARLGRAAHPKVDGLLRRGLARGDVLRDRVPLEARRGDAIGEGAPIWRDVTGVFVGDHVFDVSLSDVAERFGKAHPVKAAHAALAVDDPVDVTALIAKAARALGHADRVIGRALLFAAACGDRGREQAQGGEQRRGNTAVGQKHRLISRGALCVGGRWGASRVMVTE